MEYPLKKYQLFAILVGILLLINVLTLPTQLSFRQYLCGDIGSSLLVSHLVENGLVAGRDFYYNYGFASLWLNQLWFNTFGYTPFANECLNILCLILLCWGIAEMITVMRWSKPVVWLVLLSTSYLFCFTWFTTTHVLEPALIILCLVRYLKRSFASALLLATLALLVKPTLAYFAGLFLVFVMLTSRDGASLSRHLKRFMLNITPSLLLLFSYTAYVLPKWGWQVYFNSLVPVSGMSVYQESTYGFLGRGKIFWLPVTDDLGYLLEYYFLTPTAVWIIGSLLLVYFTILTAIQWMKTRSLSIQQRCVLICGFLHLAFVCVLFGNEWSWTYATYLVILGVAACLSLLPTLSKWLVPIYAGIMLLSLSGTIRSLVESWQDTTMRADTHYLFLTDSLHRELSQLRRLASQHRVLMLTRQGAPSLLLNDVKGIPTWVYMKNIAKEPERLAMQRLIDQADIVVVPTYGFIEMMTSWPDIAVHLKRLSVRGKTDNLLYFTTEKDKALIPSN